MYVKNPVKHVMNLQLFNDGATPATPATPATDPAPAVAPAVDPAQATGQPAVSPEPARRHNSLTDYLIAKGHFTPEGQPVQASAQPPAPGQQPQAPVPGVTPPAPAVEPAQPATPAQPQLPEKFQGKSLEEIVRSYTELEKWNTQLAQRHGLPPDLATQQNIARLASEQAQTIAQLQAQLQQNPGTQQTGAQQSVAEAAEQVMLENSMTPEEFSELMYTDPGQVMKMLSDQANRAADSRIQAWQQEQVTAQQNHQARVDHFANQMAKASADYSDFREALPQIEQYFAANPEIENLPNSIDLAYKAVKGEQFIKNPPQAPPTVEQMLADDNFKQQLLSNPAVRTAILKGQAEAIRSGQPPVVIAGQSGLSPAAGAESIKSTREAGNAARGLFQKALGGQVR